MNGPSIRELNNFNCEYKTILAKVMRKWRISTSPNLSVEILFSDEYGEYIQATIPGDFVSQFDDLLPQGSWLYVVGFQLIKETARFRNSDHNYRMVFTPETKVRPSFRVDNLDFYCFIPFENIYQGVHPPMKYTLDLYGVVESVQPLVIFTDHPYREFVGQRVRMVKFKLWDIEGYELDCVALNEDADKLAAKWDYQGPNKLIAVLSRWRLFCKDGSMSIISGKQVGEILFDPPIDEIYDLKKVLEYEGDNSDESGSSH